VAVLPGLAVVAATWEAIYIRDGFLQWDWPDPVLLWSIPLCRAVIFLALAWLVGLVGSSPHPRRPVAVLAGALTLTACLAYNGSGRTIALGTPRVVDGDLLQSTGATCLPTSAANLLRRAGRLVTEADLVAAMGTTDQGTSVSQAVYGLARLGVASHRHWVKTLAEVHAPAILWVKLGGLDHAVALLGYDGHVADVIDPCRGHRHLTEAEFAIYRWKGGALELDLSQGPAQQGSKSGATRPQWECMAAAANPISMTPTTTRMSPTIGSQKKATLLYGEALMPEVATASR
jgi:hypothetical protein